MKKVKKIFFYFHCCMWLLLSLPLYSYSVLRPYDGSPIISTSWIKKQQMDTQTTGKKKRKYKKRTKGKTYYKQDSRLEVYALFKTFDPTYFYNHLLPQEPISFRYFPEQKIDPAVLQEAMNTFFEEVQAETKEFSEFSILKNETFNLKEQAGLLVVKGKKWPLNQFVVKLFMETPRSFIQPSNKGFIAICHFIVGHGCTRYMLGFTRLKNLEMIQKMVADSPYWSERIDFPRKWFWLPDDYPWIQLTGYHISGYEKISIDIPGAYAIIEDAIDVKQEFSIKKKEDRDIGVEIFNYLQSLMDPHSNNFVYEKKTNKIVIIDTEHSPTMIGLKEPVVMESYQQWYSFLVKRGLREYFCMSNGDRKSLRNNSIPPYEGPEKYLPQIYSPKSRSVGTEERLPSEGKKQETTVSALIRTIDEQK